MKNLILIVFETNKSIGKEIIQHSQGLKQRYCDIITEEELQKNKEILKDYKAMIDCTTNGKLYNYNKNIYRGVELKEQNFTYLKTASGKIIIMAPNTSRLTSTFFNTNETILNNFKKDYNEYLSVINFVVNKLPETKNINNFEKSINEDGLILNSVLENINQSKAKIYKLVKEIPVEKAENIEYITYDNIFILNELKKVIDFIK